MAAPSFLKGGRSVRKLMWFVIGFAVSCGLCAYGRESAWMLPGGIAAVVLTVGFLFLFRRRELLSPAIGVLAGCIGGLVWFSGFYLIYLHPVSVLEGQEMQLTVTSTDYSYETDSHPMKKRKKLFKRSK